MPHPDVTILLTVLNDERAVATLESLEPSSERPREVVVADGGSDAAHLARYRAYAARAPFPVRVLDVPGSVAQSREAAWPQVQGRWIAFLDADELATPDWLRTLVAPLRGGEADFAAGPTTSLRTATRWDRYHARLDDWFYRNYVARDIVFAPMGNTAWDPKVFDALRRADGYAFDARLARGGEDFDLTIRALQRGFRGRFVPEAVVHHDYARVRGVRRTLRKKYHYAMAEFRLNRRHASFFAARPPLGKTEPKPRHPVELLEPFVRRYARWKSRGLD